MAVGGVPQVSPIARQPVDPQRRRTIVLAWNAGLVAAILQVSLVLLTVAIGCIAVAVALQGRGHRLEPVPPEPFSGPLNVVSRLFFEQWVTFPRFVVSGGWGAALRRAREP